MRIAHLHVDIDVHDATLHCLETLSNEVTRGGMIVFDDYSGINEANKAIDKFLLGQKSDYSPIRKLGLYSRPSYLVKG